MLMAITPNNTSTVGRPGLETMNEERIRKAFADLNGILAEEGSIYGISATFARDTLIRTQVVRLPATADEGVEVEKTYGSTTSNYDYYN